MIFNQTRALELLRIGCGNPTAEFHDGQDHAIEQTLRTGARMLVVQRTGWGKSFVYFIAAKLLRETGSGPTLLVSPLLSLMRNQIAAAERMGVRAARITSDNTNEWDTVTEQIEADDVDILLIAPERLANKQFRGEVLPTIARNASLLVVDEAHCISDWGHDFRPHYRLIQRLTSNLPASLRLLATTATANQRVMNDLVTVLGDDLKIVRGNLARPGLTLQTHRIANEADRMAWLDIALRHIDGSGIIYCLTKRDANRIADWLLSRGHTAASYTGDTGKRRPELEQQLLDNELKVLVATVALGMGFDKPDLRFVIHYQAPGSVVAYYQQVGRAGRTNDGAHGILLSGPHDIEINQYFIDKAFPRAQNVDAVIDCIRHSPAPCSEHTLLRSLNIKDDQLRKILQLLLLEDNPPIVKDEALGWQLTGHEYDNSLQHRAKRISKIRESELDEMQQYIDLDSGHMAYLLNALDSAEAIDVDFGPSPVSVELEPDTVAAAQEHLAPDALVIEPRKQWPAGGITQFDEKGNIKEEDQNQPGRALCRWGDPTVGELIRTGKYEDDHFSDDLIDLAADTVRDWNPDIEWICGIPSGRRPSLVPSFCNRLADKLGLSHVPVLIATEIRPPQKTMQNRFHQARNVDGVFALDSTLTIPEAPVLLVDDMVDSKWTMTVAGRILQLAGARPVFPFALAATWGGEA